MKKKFSGVYVPMITPLSEDGGHVNEDALRTLCRFLIQKGVHGLFPVGTTGECALLTLEERKRIAEVVVDETTGAIPVIIHTGAITTRETVELTRHAQKIGADGAAIVVPYYYALEDSEIFEHYDTVLKEIHDFPILLYNIPGNAKNYVKPSVVKALRGKHDHLVGVKNSIASLTDFQEFVAIDSSNFYSFIGNDRLILPALVIGACGSVSSNSLVFPELFVELHEHYRAGRLEQAREVQRKINRFVSVAESGRGVAKYKAGLRLRGIQTGGLRPPLQPLLSEEKDKWLQYVQQLAQEFNIKLESIE
jgi:4-hydroxy-tetrahydrodipicolinate synthase